MISIRCPRCNKLLTRVAGLGTYIQVKCDRCKGLVEWPTLTPHLKDDENDQLAAELGITAVESPVTLSSLLTTEDEASEPS